MTARQSDDIAGWFRARGLTIALAEDGGEWWASLRAGDRTVAPRYGRGRTPEAALRRAKMRYIEEEAPHDTR